MVTRRTAVLGAATTALEGAALNRDRQSAPYRELAASVGVAKSLRRPLSDLIVQS
ncbi:hypothetical protein [Denitrobaculum tricleocarpae]|uniref:hypothetical protein n=1 Tax=Denitrobaculum tricleocarpae TaxID=2591009 RepID=UPI0015D45883|nr:hypothetical protein [Denitrobaculum tricleocarpae]